MNRGILIVLTLISSVVASAWNVDPVGAEERRKPVELTQEQREIIEKGATEPPFKNEYWDESRDGIYVDRVSGEPLFSSKAKFNSGSGWPSFFEPIVKGEIIERMDHSAFMKRVEIRAKDSNSHLGHLFDDGPKPTGQRYCVNSASLRFIPKEDLEAEGYGEFLKQFTQEEPAANSNSQPSTESTAKVPAAAPRAPAAGLAPKP